MQDRRTNGLITLHRYGAEHFSRLAERSRSAYAYGDSDAAKRQRMRDLRAKREYLRQHGLVEGLRRWEALVALHTQQFAPRHGEKGGNRDADTR